jgi:hypothetical protein
MNIPNFSIQISASAVAWYAAIVSTLSLVMSLFLAWRDRARISISINPNMMVRNVPQYDPEKTYINITVRNRGRRPVKIQTVYLKLYRTKGFVLVSDSIHQHVQRVLSEDNPRTNFLIDQGLIDPAAIEYALVTDESGKQHIKYQRRGSFVRRLVSRWLPSFDYREPPAPK